jgi:hypothetical protein
MACSRRFVDGLIETEDGWGGRIVDQHPLECIESEEKSQDGLHGISWEIRKLREEHWEAKMAEVFCSADPDAIQDYIASCRPIFREAFPTSRARAFVWYLKDGPLVTFHQRKNRRRRWPIKIMARYLLPWNEWGQVRPWHGDYDDILEQMDVEYPFPRQ